MIVGESNDVFVIVQQGVQEGEEVLLNPLADVDDAGQQESSNTVANTSGDKPTYPSTGINDGE